MLSIENYLKQAYLTIQLLETDNEQEEIFGEVCCCSSLVGCDTNDPFILYHAQHWHSEHMGLAVHVGLVLRASSIKPFYFINEEDEFRHEYADSIDYPDFGKLTENNLLKFIKSSTWTSFSEQINLLISQAAEYAYKTGWRNCPDCCFAILDNTSCECGNAVIQGNY